MVLLRHQLFRPSEVFIIEQARAMRRFRPVLLGRSLAGSPLSDIAYRVPTARGMLAKSRYALFRDPRLLLPALQGLNPEVIHAHFGVEAVYGLELARSLHLPLVTTFHGFDATMRTLRLITARKLSLLMYALKRAELARRGTIFLCVSEYIRKRVIDLGFPEQLTRLHYIGVDTSSFLPNCENPESPIVLHAARLVEKKGTRFLLRAFARLAGRYRRARLVIIGEGPLKQELAKLSASLGLESRVDWLGSLPHHDVKRWMQRASLLCLPSCTANNGDAEGLGMVLLEAAASGVPTVATQHGGIPEVVLDGQTGYLVRERDILGLSGALETLLDSYELRRSLGKSAKALVEERFDIVRQTALLERIYESV